MSPGGCGEEGTPVDTPSALLAAARQLLTHVGAAQQRRAPAASGPATSGAPLSGDAGAAAGTRRSHQLGSRLLVALSLIARADYVSPHCLLASADVMLPLATYLAHLPASALSLGPAAQALLMYGVCCTATRERSVAAVQAALAAAQLLHDPEARAVVARQLARLHAPAAPGGERLQAPPQLLTVQQLQHVCWSRVADRGAALLDAHRAPASLLHAGSMRLTAGQLAEVQAAVDAAAAALPALEPNNPKGLLAAGAALAALRQQAEATELYLRALRVAQAQGSGYYEVRAAAALLAGSPTSLLAPDTSGELQLRAPARVAAAVLAQAGPTLQQCERVLPAVWWVRLRAEVSRGWRAATTADAHLNLFRLLGVSMPTKGASPAAAPAALYSDHPAAAQHEQQEQHIWQQPQRQPLQQQRQQQLQSPAKQPCMASNQALWDAAAAGLLLANNLCGQAGLRSPVPPPGHPFGSASLYSSAQTALQPEQDVVGAPA